MAALGGIQWQDKVKDKKVSLMYSADDDSKNQKFPTCQERSDGG
jgi:hypothetical protein